jgi:hypothetical protein
LSKRRFELSTNYTRENSILFKNDQKQSTEKIRENNKTGTDKTKVNFNSAESEPRALP